MSDDAPNDSGRHNIIEDNRDVDGARAGNGEAYRRLVERYQSEIVGQMRRFSRDPLVQAELTQEVFVQAYISLGSYRGTAPFLHWLRRIAVRVGYRYWSDRKARSNQIILSEDDWRRLQSMMPEPEEATDSAELVFSLLAQLAPGDRLILTLIYLDGSTMAEVAERTGWTIIGAKVRAFRARNRLRKLIKDGFHAE